MVPPLRKPWPVLGHDDQLKPWSILRAYLERSRPACDIEGRKTVVKWTVMVVLKELTVGRITGSCF